MTTRASLLAALAALACLAPGAARAQGCIGAPVAEGGRAASVVAGASTYDVGGDVDGTDLGLDYRANPAGPLGYAVGYTLRSMGEADARMHVGTADLAFRLPLRLPVGLCARAGVGAGRLTQSGSTTGYTNLTFPLGAVVELPFAMGEGATLAPYVAPLYLYSRTSGQVFGVDFSANDSGFGVEAGVGVRWNRVVVSGGYLGSSLSTELGTPVYPEQLVFVRVGVAF